MNNLTKEEVKELRKIRLSLRRFANVMRKRLEDKFINAGYHGWDNEKYLLTIMSNVRDKCAVASSNIQEFDDHVDLANLLMFDYFLRKKDKEIGG